jgi:aryl-alcohol dehydrogenase-like predicted oxidoreductase
LVGSKWGYYYTADWRVDNGDQPHEVKEHTYKNLAKQTAESDELLGGFIDLYQIHSATKESGVCNTRKMIIRI